MTLGEPVCAADVQTIVALDSQVASAPLLKTAAPVADTLSRQALWTKDLGARRGTRAE
jgi:hypothetical protein